MTMAAKPASDLIVIVIARYRSALDMRRGILQLDGLNASRTRAHASAAIDARSENDPTLL
jgi:hypothetical protein